MRRSFLATVKSAAAIAWGVILAALAISKVAAQAPIAQIQAEGVRVALEIANAKLAAIGARTRFSQVD